MKRLISLTVIFTATLAAVVTIILTSEPPGPAPQQVFECGASGNPCEINGRHYNIAAPTGEGPFPVVIFFHGSRQSGDKTLRRERFVDAFVRRGYAFVAPTALDIDYVRGPGTGWLNEGRKGDRDDHQFVIDMLGDLKRRFPIDDQKILVTGSSNGATYSWYLACANIDPRLKFFAPHGGTQVIKGAKYQPRACENSALNFHILHAHGKHDKVIPPEGLPRANGMVGYRGVEESVSEFALKAGCNRVNVYEIAAYKAQIWWECRNRQEYGFTIHDGGHGTPPEWPEFVLDWYETFSENTVE